MTKKRRKILVARAFKLRLKGIFICLLYMSLYPLSVAFRVTSIYLQIVAITASISFPVGVGLVVAHNLQQFFSEDYWIWIGGALLSFGLVPVLLSAIGKKAWNTLIDITKGFKDVDWNIFPDWKFPEAWKQSCNNIMKISNTVQDMFSKGWTLAKLAMLIFLISTLTTLVFPSTESRDQYHIIVVGSEEFHVNEIKKYLFKGGATFSLTYLKNANATGDGICLNKSQQEWLTVFRRAITECVEQTKDPAQQVPVLQVIGFSSSAPANPDDKAVNCEFANRRAKAVAAFLAGNGKEEWNCDDMKSANAIGRAQGLCAPEDVWVKDATDAFYLKIKQWNDHADMVNGRPANDGSPSDGLTSAAELLNRSVHIEVPKDFCQVK